MQHTFHVITWTKINIACVFKIVKSEEKMINNSLICYLKSEKTNSQMKQKWEVIEFLLSYKQNLVQCYEEKL